MRLLIVDRTVVGQASLASKIEKFDQADHELLNISMNLCDATNFESRLDGTDVVLLGADLGEEAKILANAIKVQYPKIEILMFIDDHEYLRGVFRGALVSRVRKIFALSASSVDLLQELVRINEQFRTQGRTRSGEATVFIQGKGGVGTTTLCAALAEISGEVGLETLLIDLDIETSDLGRSLMAKGSRSEVVSAWVDGTREITRESLNEAVVPLGKNISLLSTPESLAASMDLVSEMDGVRIAGRVLDLARVSYKNIFIDLAGRLSPLAGSVLRVADNVVVVIDDSVLGLTAVPVLLSKIAPILSDLNSLSFVCSGTRLTIDEIRKEVEQAIRLGDHAWRLPAIPYDSSAGRWAGSGKTLYSAGNRTTKAVLQQIAQGLGVVPSIGAHTEKVVPLSSALPRLGLAESGQAVRQLMRKVTSFT